MSGVTPHLPLHPNVLRGCFGECASRDAGQPDSYGTLLVLFEYVLFVLISLAGGFSPPKNISICGYLELFAGLDRVLLFSRCRLRRRLHDLARRYDGEEPFSIFFLRRFRWFQGWLALEHYLVFSVFFRAVFGKGTSLVCCCGFILLILCFREGMRKVFCHTTHMWCSSLQHLHGNDEN